MVGQELVRQLIASDEYNNIIILSRRETGFSSPKLTEHLVDFDHPDQYSEWVHGDHAFCCLGTTMKKAGSKESFRKVDFQYVHDFAEIAATNGVSGFSLISSLGASAKSAVFYSRVKGEIEAAVSALGFQHLNIFRPSLLLGNRQEARPNEEWVYKVYKILDPLMPKRYKGIQASVVARGMIRESLKDYTGLNLFLSDKIQETGKP